MVAMLFLSIGSKVCVRDLVVPRRHSIWILGGRLTDNALCPGDLLTYIIEYTSCFSALRFRAPQRFTY